MSSAESHNVDRLRERLVDYMEQKGLRSTEQRRVVTERFFKSEGHLSIEDLLTKVRGDEPKIGYATVYRTLKLLKECGLAYERHFGDGVSRYEVAWEDEHHDHLICVECGTIIEFEHDDIEQAQDRVAKNYGYKLVRHKHELYGICPSCQRKPAKA